MLLAIAGGWRTLRGRTGSAKRKLLVLLVALAALVLFAPSIVIYTPLRQRVLTMAVPPEAARIEVDSLTVGWLTPVTATGIKLYDPEGNRLAEAQKLSIDRTVIGFLTSSDDLGTIRLEGATLYALARPDGSNIEDALARAAAAGGEGSGGDQLDTSAGGPSYVLQIAGGRILSRDAVTGDTWSAESLEAQIDHPGSGPLRVKVAGLMRPASVEDGGPRNVSPQTTAGRFELEWGGDDAQQMQRWRCVCQQLPTSALTPWLRRVDPQAAVMGELTGEMSAAYPNARYDSLSGDTTGRISLSNFAVASSALGGEQLAVNDTALAWKCTASGGRVSVESLSLASDIARFDLRGALDERMVREVVAGTAEPHALVTHGDLEAEGALNLARLAQRLPNLLKVREGTTITSGQVQFNARTMPHSGGHQLTASLTTTPLAGRTRGRAIEWDAPLSFDLVARHAADDWRFDRLTCRSQFVEVTGSGDARQMQLTGRVDLDELTSRLDQFVDLTDWQLAGRGQLEAKCRRDETGQFVADASGTLTDFVIAWRGAALATEPQLEWAANAAGAATAGRWPDRLTQAELSLSAAGDELTAKLTQPTLIDQTWAATDWPLELTTSGRLNGWTRRIRPWVDLSSWSTSGQLQLAARGRVRSSPLNLQIVSSQVTVDRLRATTPTLQIEEPQAQWSGDIAWDSTTGTLVSRSGQLVTSSVSAGFRDWYWTADPQQTGRVGGLAAVRMDLSRLARVRKMPPGELPKVLPIGQVSGNIKLAAQGDQVVAAVDLGGKDIQIQKPAAVLPGAAPKLETIWSEPNLRLVGTVSYAPQLDRLKFDGLQTQAATLAIAASGSIDAVSSTRQLNLAGTIDYDLGRLSPVFAQYIGGGLTINGREQARFEVSGPLSEFTTRTSGDPGSTVVFSQASANSASAPTPWAGRLLAPWQSASLYGLPIGQGRISAEMRSGKVTIEPLDFAVGGGRLTASPAVALAPAPGQLTLPAGPLLTNIRITPDVSNRLIKFIMPVLAEATQTEGVFSMNLSGATVPLGAPAAADVAGQLAVQSVRMVPGPAAGELIGLIRELETLIRTRNLLSGGATAQQPITLLSVSDRTVDFRLVDGRVYHQGLEFQIGEVQLRSRGSVGLDETLSLMLELRLPDKWLGRSPQGSGVIEVPVTGSLGGWKIDRQAALASLKTQVIDRFLNEETIGNALDKLFGNGR